jgi:uncharacterized phage protein gp47/JayE
MAQVTPTGFVAKTEQEYFDEEKQLYLDIDSNWNLDPSTPDGLKLASDAEIFTNLDEAAQQAYNSKDPNKSQGIELDIICALTGVFRDLGSPSTVTLSFTGVNGTVIPAGELYESTVDDSQWATDSEVTIAGGVASVGATCTVNGSTNADIGTITRIINTIGGLQTVNNASPATSGRDKEDDGDLRLRRAQSVARPGNNQVDSMIGEILSVTGVKQVVIFENDTNVTDSNGLPPHSIAPLVDGGTDEDVALAIYLKKNPGCALHSVGTLVQVEVTSPVYPQNKKVITFSRPIDLAMTVVVDITDDGTLPANADDLVTNAIIEYAEGDLIATGCGFNSTGFVIGEDVPVSRLNTPVNQVIGQYGNSYVTGLTVNGQSVGLVPVDFNEISRWLAGNITVNIT